MATGMQALDADGRVLLDVSRSYSQHQGSFYTAGTNGSGTMSPLPAGKTRFYFIVGNSDGQGYKGKYPGVTISGNSITWSYSHSTWWGQFSMPSTIYYGYY